MASLTAILFVILFTAMSHLCTQVSGANRGKVIPNSNRMNSDQFLGPGDTLTSADGESWLQVNRDCNVVLKSEEKEKIWESKSQLKGFPYCVLILIDGILTVRENADDIWHSNNAPLTPNSKSYLLVLQEMLVVYDNEDNQPIWFSTNQTSS